MLIFSIIFCLIAESFAQSIALGECPYIPAKPLNFNLLNGTWFEYATSHDCWDTRANCVNQHWSLPNKGRTEVIFTSTYTLTNETLRTVADAFTKSDNALAFNIRSPIFGVIYEERRILKINYEEYVVSWSCTTSGFKRMENVAIYTRSPKPAVNVIEIAQNACLENGLLFPEIIPINNENCF